MTVSNYLANPLIRSIVYGGDCHMQVLLAARLSKGLCRMKSRGTVIWTNVPCTTAKTFRSWLKDWGWQETTPWTWKRNDITLCAPSHREADSQCHHIRMSWHETRLRQRQTPWRARVEEFDIPTADACKNPKRWSWGCQVKLHEKRCASSCNHPG